VEEVGGLHLFMKKFLVDQTVKHSAAVVVGELGQGAIGQQSFVTEGFVPVGLQNDAAVDGGDDAIDHFGRDAGKRKPWH
jgi:hypothetical protein